MRGNPMHFTARRAFALLCVSALIAANLFVFGPFTIYSGNVDEFMVSLSYILVLLSIPALVLVALLVTVGFFLSDRAYRRYVSVLFIFGLLIWVQGNILVWKYGLLDGQGIDWSRGTWRGWVDGALWVLLLGLAFLLSKHVYKMATLSSLVLIFLQLVSSIAASLQNPEIWKEKALLTAPSKELFEFSPKQNVIQFILDGFQSDIFQEIIDEDREYYYNALEGFIFFQEAIGSFPTTKMSIPAALSGKNFHNDVPMSDFISKISHGRTIPNVYNGIFKLL
jgi:hypothetical protein